MPCPTIHPAPDPDPGTKHPVRADRGQPSIDTAAWVRARTGAEHPHLTRSLHNLRGVAPFHQPHHPPVPCADLAVAWCTARGFPVAEHGPLVHDSPLLDQPVTVVLADAGRHGAIAVVNVGNAPPRVYTDLTTDKNAWYDAATVEIRSPHGHRWTSVSYTHLTLPTNREV